MITNRKPANSRPFMLGVKVDQTILVHFASDPLCRTASVNSIRDAVPRGNPARAGLPEPGVNPVVPTADDLTAVRNAIKVGGTVVLMKIGKRLQAILSVLEETGTLESSVFVSRAGQKDQSIETDLKKLKNADEKAGYLSIILTHVGKEMN